MFKKIRMLINTETKRSRSIEIVWWIGIFLLIDIFLILLMIGLSVVFQGDTSIGLSLFAVFFIGNLTSLGRTKEFYLYLYSTHPYTIKLDKEKALKEQQLLESRKKMILLRHKQREKKELEKKKKIEEENIRRKRNERKRREENEKNKQIDILVRNALSIENAHESLNKYIDSKNITNFTYEDKLKWLEIRDKELKDIEYALNHSPLINYFGAVEGGETTLYYLKLKNKFGETRYKIGVTLNSVAKRYAGKSGYKILYEKKLTHANTIEKKILEKFNHLVTDESLLGTNGTEILKEDILKLDTDEYISD